MQEVNEKLAKSLSGESSEILPFIPYLLQDLWDLGSSPKDIEKLIKNNIKLNEDTSIIDLACGKGAVSVHLAKAFGCRIIGYDLIGEFIDYAKQKSKEYEVEGLCNFFVEDINQTVLSEKNYDIVILGAVGDVLGNPYETLNKLINVAIPNGYIIIDDAYNIYEETNNYFSKKQWMDCFSKLGLSLIEEMPIDLDELKTINRRQQPLIKKRAEQLIIKYPSKTELFNNYIKSQEEECCEIEGDLQCVTWLLQIQ